MPGQEVKLQGPRLVLAAVLTLTGVLTTWVLAMLGLWWGVVTLGEWIRGGG